MLPTRLLDVGDNNTDLVKLLNTADNVIADRRYVALSYCWGRSKNFTTTRSTLKKHLAGFSLSDMPLTLREAVITTRRLGLSYLWIDALCIIQGTRDDPESLADWRRESRCMDRIYGHAFLTIVAASSRDCQDGLSTHGSPCTSIWENSKDNISDDQPGSRDKLSIQDEAITERAWALQEWLLSQRLLIFTSTGVYFVCNKHNINADNAVYKLRLPRSLAQVDDRDRQKTMTKSASSAADRRRLRRSPAPVTYADWHRIVANFCARSLTVAEDKLPALSGLAKKFAEIKPEAHGDYLAGLWRANLANDLLWRRETLGEGPGQFLSRPDKIGRSHLKPGGRAPSWSWASVDGPIGMLGNRSTTPTVLDCWTTPAEGHDMFGQIASGTLVIRSLYKKASIEGTRDNPQCCDGDGVKFAAFWGDDPLEADRLLEEHMELYCVALTKQRDYGEGIVLRYSEERNVFVRVGYFIRFVEKLFTGFDKEREFTVV